ncbi:hypothetical protein [Palleronia sp.]|uniref:hypothetical protein n=1 Tax=Palleronia sp. TaxID=1940284 RepID=UPI0035C7FAC7
MLRRVHFHGPLRAQLEGPIEVAGETVAEVIESITRQLPAFAPNPTTGRHRLQVVCCRTLEDLHRPLGDVVELHVCPQMMGGKNQNVTQILIGAVLIGIAFIPGMQAAAPWLIRTGTLMILGGVAGMLAPTPDDDRQIKSQYLGAPRNTTRIGTRIPILYGKYRWGGHYLSFDINAIEFRGSGANGTSGGK